jgi:dihydroxyacetone kinase-like protein
MKDSFRERDGEGIVLDMIRTIQENSGLLSEIDGAIGDGDHGVNMNKGFTICQKQLEASPGGFASGLQTVGRVLLAEIGGAMGPLYGTFFLEMAGVAARHQDIGLEVFQQMLESASQAVMSLGDAKVGDKTMVDTLVAAVDAYKAAVASGADFAAALAAMAKGAEQGKESTRDLVAKVGRASRLGERSRGVLDAGAASCAFLLQSMASSIAALLAKQLS